MSCKAQGGWTIDFWFKSLGGIVNSDVFNFIPSELSLLKGRTWKKRLRRLVHLLSRHYRHQWVYVTIVSHSPRRADIYLNGSKRKIKIYPSKLAEAIDQL